MNAGVRCATQPDMGYSGASRLRSPKTRFASLACIGRRSVACSPGTGQFLTPRRVPDRIALHLHKETGTMRDRILRQPSSSLPARPPSSPRSRNKAATRKGAHRQRDQDQRGGREGGRRDVHQPAGARGGLGRHGNGFMKAADFAKTMNRLKIASWHFMDTRGRVDRRQVRRRRHTPGWARHLHGPAGAGDTGIRQRCGPSATASGSRCSTRKALAAPPPPPRRRNRPQKNATEEHGRTRINAGRTSPRVLQRFTVSF